MPMIPWILDDVESASNHQEKKERDGEGLTFVQAALTRPLSILSLSSDLRRVGEGFRQLL
jgi:hypothetical protein